MSYPVRNARARILEDHDDVIGEVERCADAVAAAWDDADTRAREDVTDPMSAALEATGTLEQLPGVLADAVEAAGGHLRAPPVAAPPYVVVTSRGPVLRATLEMGRLVIRFDAFEVVRHPGADDPPTYRRRDDLRLTVSLG
ncbi:hypothetical protein [Natrarchaeobaculum aegyptiacum]|uniref:DUF7988 domain-containing protein n=1 Tax=Natrarchaeobaculum aegyptiacum TaxID=745377 RepID=A0A2Z2HSG8_9EURY|nr:hypothetical protein [Natrarchaeobaculum aegyptiacum]ARS88337.1 hypothetical protein B1756_00210 [Natrarchaeobaculum aegyptiacum]